MEHHCLALPILNVFRKLTFVYRGVTSPIQRLLWNNVLNMSCNLHNTVLKNTIVMALSSVALVALVCLSGCAGSSDQSQGKESFEVKNAKVQGREQDKQTMLEDMFKNFLMAIREDTPADELYAMLTDSSEYWLDTLEHHARIYGPEELDTCQFYEAYSILLYRLYEREHLWQVPEDRMLWLYLSKAGVIHNFTKLKLGPMKMKNDRG